MNSKKQKDPVKETIPQVVIHDCKFVGNEWNGDVVRLLNKTVDGLLDVVGILKSVTLTNTTAISLIQPKEATSSVSNVKISGYGTGIDLRAK